MPPRLITPYELELYELELLLERELDELLRPPPPPRAPTGAKISSVKRATRNHFVLFREMRMGTYFAYRKTILRPFLGSGQE